MMPLMETITPVTHDLGAWRGGWIQKKLSYR